MNGTSFEGFTHQEALDTFKVIKMINYVVKLCLQYIANFKVKNR